MMGEAAIKFFAFAFNKEHWDICRFRYSESKDFANKLKENKGLENEFFKCTSSSFLMWTFPLIIFNF